MKPILIIYAVIATMMPTVWVHGAIESNLVAIDSKRAVGIEVRPSAHYFGTIAEQDGRVTADFKLINRTSSPIIIVRTYTSCGCTAAEFSRKPVAPADSTIVRVTYDPEGRPGAFSKSVAVYAASDSGEMRTELTISGKVSPRPQSLTERYPIELGRGVRLQVNAHAFGYVAHGVPSQTRIGIVNTSQRAVSLRLTPTAPNNYFTAVYPSLLAPNKEYEIVLTYDLPPRSNLYGHMEELLTIDVDGHRAPLQMIVRGIAIDDLDTEEDISGAKMQLSKNIIKFGVAKVSQKPLQADLTITNTGSSPLYLRALQSDNTAFTATADMQKPIQPHQSRTLRVEFDPTTTAGVAVGHLLIVCNDAERPTQTVKLTAIVEY